MLIYKRKYENYENLIKFYFWNIFILLFKFFRSGFFQFFYVFFYSSQFSWWFIAFQFIFPFFYIIFHLHLRLISVIQQCAKVIAGYFRLNNISKLSKKQVDFTFIDSGIWKTRNFYCKISYTSVIPFIIL